MRWWDGIGWTEHVALPEPEPEPEPQPLPHGAEPMGQVVQLDAHRAQPHAVDDAQLRPRARDEVFAGAPRGPVRGMRERMRPSLDGITSLRGMQVLGLLAFTVLCWWIGVHGVLDGGGGWLAGACLALGVFVPLGAKVLVEVQVRNEFWRQLAASRGMQSRVGRRAGEQLPGGLQRVPLFGPAEERIVDLVATRELCGREAWAGVLTRLTSDVDEPRFGSARVDRATFVVLTMPEVAAARWPGASIRADHGARRPLVQRAMVGALIASVAPNGRAHLAVADGQDPTMLQRLVDVRLDGYLAEHPMDVDIVGDLLVVTRDGSPSDVDHLEELCRDALLLHELLVSERELAAALPQQQAPAAPQADEPVIDTSRSGWGDQLQQYGGDQLAA